MIFHTFHKLLSSLFHVFASCEWLDLLPKLPEKIQLQITDGRNKAELLQEGIFLLIHLFARDFLLMKKLEIEKLSPLLLYQF